MSVKTKHQSEHSEEPSFGIPFSVGENIKTLTIGAEFRCIKHTLKKEPIRIVQRGLEAHKAGGGGGGGAPKREGEGKK